MTLHLKHKKRNKIEIETLKQNFKEKCCFKEKPIPTETVFDLLGFNYSNIYDREFIYHWVSNWTELSIQKYWNILIEEGFKEQVFRKFSEKCWLEKEPFGYFEDGYFYSPKTYAEWEILLNKYAIRSLLGFTKTLQKMAHKGMIVNDKIPAIQLLNTTSNIIKTLEISEKELIEYKEEETKK